MPPGPDVAGMTPTGRSRRVSGRSGPVSGGQRVRQGEGVADAVVDAHTLVGVTRQVQPWPFATNAAGASRFFQSRSDAIDYVAAQRRFGVQSIDVGCFQINLRHHPNAFGTLEKAFDPDANARYAAHFLKALYSQTGI